MDIIRVSCTTEFKEQLKEFVHKGEWSSYLVGLAKKDFERLSGKKRREQWIKNTVVPELRTILKDYDYAMLSDLDERRHLRIDVLKKLNGLMFELSDDELRLAIGVLMNERETG